MLEKINKLYGNMFVLAVFSLILGLVLLINPEVSEKVLCYSVAGLLAVYGIVHIALHFISREAFTFPKDLVLGILAVAFGIVFIVFPQIILRILPIVFGGIIVIDGVMKIINALDLKKETYLYWWIVLLMGFISILLGILTILDLFEISILLFTGASLVINGIFDAFNVFVIAKYKK